MFKLFTRSSILLLLCSIFFAIQTASAAITPQIDASRVSGVAPLSVFFDATSTTSTATGKPFHELHYAWDFGDQNAGNWQYGNPGRKDKNLATGPVAAHVFETPGTYTVRLTTKGLYGVSASKSVTVTVQNPDSVFSGSNTICFSSTGNYTSCPVDAQHITTDSFQAAMAYATAGKRLLFKRGESWTASEGSEINNDGPGLIGAYGSGNRPIIRSTSSSDLIEFSRGSSGHTNDWRIMDLDISSSSSGSEMIHADNTVNNLLLLRLKGRNFYRFIAIAANVLDYYGSTIHKNIFVVDNDFEGSASHGSYVAAESLAYMGNRLKDSPNSHVLRITYANPLVIANNSFLGGSGPSHHLLKFHSFSPDNDNYRRNHSSSGQFVIADNIVDHGSQGDWAFALGPQSSSGDRPENVRTGIIERNHFIAGSNTQTFLMLWTSEVTARNNLFDQTGSSHAIQISRRNQEDAPHDNSVHNNTFYSAESGNSLTAVVVDSVASNTTIRNNLLYTSSGSGSVLSGSAVQSSNLVMAGLSQNNDSRFLPVGNAIDGVSTAMVLDDYDNNPRPLSAQDIGAYESNGGAESPVPPAPSSPTVSLVASPSSITVGGSSALSWSTTNVDSCTASGGWSGSKSTSGTQTVSPGSNASYTLSCSGEGGSASDSVTVSVSSQADTTAPSIPTNATASSITQSSATISWDTSTDNIGVTGYNLYYRGEVFAVTPDTSLPLTGLSPDTTYSWMVSATDAAGNESSQSSLSSFTTRKSAAAAPPVTPSPTVSLTTSSSAITAGGSSTLSWSTTNADSCTASGGWSGSKSTSGTQTVSPGSNASYTLSCSGEGGSASDNVTVSVSSQADTTAPSIPTNTTASSITQSSAIISWNTSTDNVGVTGYNLYYRGEVFAVTPNTSLPLTGLSPDTTYSWMVSATDAAGNESSQSSLSSFTTRKSAAAAPPVTPSPTVNLTTSSSAITVGGSSTLSWSTTNADSCTASGGWSGSKSTSGTQTVSPGSNASYTLSCSGEGGSASDSVTVSVSSQADTTAPSIPINATASSITQSSATISWDTSTDNVGVTGYILYYRGEVFAVTPNTSMPLTGLSPDTTYSWMVSATDAAGNESSQSSLSSFTTLRSNY